MGGPNKPTIIKETIIISLIGNRICVDIDTKYSTSHYATLITGRWNSATSEKLNTMVKINLKNLVSNLYQPN